MSSLRAMIVDPHDERVGLLLPNAIAAVVSFFGLQAFGRVPAMLNYSTGTRNVTSACATPGATDMMLLEPEAVIPRKTFMIPITVPSRPMSGETEPITASHPMP